MTKRNRAIIPKTKPGIRIDEDIHEWLFNHRTTKEPNISDVIRGLIDFKYWGELEGDECLG